MNDTLLRLHKANYWANMTLCETLTPEVYNDYIAETFSHVVNAQYIWMSRIEGIPSPYKVREIQPLAQLPERIQTISEKWLHYLKNASLQEFQRVIHYTNSFGETFNSIILDVCFHLISHSHYHRGQVNRALRLCKVEPKNIDYITYCRLVDAGKISSTYL
ncbi:MAG: DinB family protein [Cytophagales bacterium]|nr:DinB family protein [Cytophagales bacterium]MDW8383955.1 DinB family protein [Flammeovirgaceae bacterium]